MMKDREWIWVFHGDNADLCSALFDDREDAEKWIKENYLSGLLTKMPLNKSVYDWAIESDFFSPKKEYQNQGKFIQRFTSAYLEHHHYENGELRGN